MVIKSCAQVTAPVRFVEAVTEFAAEADLAIEVGPGHGMARLIASDGAALRRDLVAVLTALGGAPLPRLWLN